MAKQSVSKKSTRFVLYDANGTALQNFPYNAMKPFSEDLSAFRVTASGRWGFCGPDGAEVITPSHSATGVFSQGLAWASTGRKTLGRAKGLGKCGFIDAEGSTVIAAEYEGCRDFSEGLSAVNIGGENLGHTIDGGAWGFIDLKGQWALPADGRFIEAGSYSEGLAAVRLSSHRWCYVDTRGEVVLALEPSPSGLSRLYGPFSGGLARVVETPSRPEAIGRYWYIDKTGHVAIDPRPGNRWTSGDFSEGRSAFKRDDLFGFIDASGTTVIEPAYGQVYEFCNNLAAVRRKGTKTGFINRSGELVLPCDFKSATRMSASGFIARS